VRCDECEKRLPFLCSQGRSLLEAMREREGEVKEDKENKGVKGVIMCV
jgi:hypothetical protein